MFARRSHCCFPERQRGASEMCTIRDQRASVQVGGKRGRRDEHGGKRYLDFTLVNQETSPNQRFSARWGSPPQAHVPDWL